MKCRFNHHGDLLVGFIGFAADGLTYLAVPSVRWEVCRCDSYRVFDKVGSFSPGDLDDWTDDHEVEWCDCGNGISWFNRDMVLGP